MQSVWRVFTATGRQRWGAWLALSVLIAVVGGAVLASAGAARATERAFPDYEHRYGADVGLWESGAPPSAYTSLPNVSSYVVMGGFANGSGTAGSDFIPVQDFSVLTLPVAGKEPAFRLLAGHLPRTRSEAIAGFSLEQDASLHIGSTITVPLEPNTQPGASSPDGDTMPQGPSFTFHVVGFYASIIDFPSSAPSYTMIVSNAFAHSEAAKYLSGDIILLRLRGGSAAIPRYSYEADHVATRGYVYPFAISLVTNVVSQSLRPLVVGWWIFALIACLVGLGLVAQGLSRQSIIERASYPTLSAVGVSPGQLFWLGMLRAAVIAAAGAAIAVGLAVLVSPLTLVGEARASEPSTGVIVDPLVLGIGALAIVVAVLVLAVLPSWRASRSRSLLAAQESSLRRANPIAVIVARIGAPPTVLVGVRHALERGRGRTSVPVATALTGTCAAVVALVGSLVFGASLTTLLSTPRLWGQAWQLDLGGFTEKGDASIFTALARSSNVLRSDYGISHQEIEVNGVLANLVAYVDVKGPPVFVSIRGHNPTAPGEIALGSTTAADAHASIGSMVKVKLIGPDGKPSVARLRLVGVTAIPPTLGGGSTGDGAFMLLPTLFNTICGTGTESGPCRSSFQKEISVAQFAWGGAAAFRSTPAAKAMLLATKRRYAAELTVITKPTALVNFGGGINFPLLLGLTMALFGAATLLHLIVVSVTRRRREHALLKVLGFVRMQVRATVNWQAATIAVIGILVGVPLGIAAGRLAWRSFAAQQGVLTDTVVPVGQLALIGAAVLVVSLAFSLVPAVLATKHHPAAALRDE